MRICLFIFLLLPCLVSASYVDSLKTTYQREQNDSLKARTCISIGEHYEYFQIDKAIKWGDKAVKHARKFNDQLFLVKVLNYSATFHATKGNYQRQANLTLEAISIAEKNQFYRQLGGLASNLGGAYVNLEDRDQAIHWLLKSIEIKKEHSDSVSLAISLGNLGSYFTQLKEYEEALRYHQQALDVRRRHDPENIALHLSNVATSLMLLERFDEAKPLFDETYRIRKEAEEFYRLNSLMLEYSWFFERQNNYLKAIAYADSVYEFSKREGFKNLEHDAAIQLGTVYYQYGNYEKGYEYLLEAYNLWKDLYQEEAMENLNNLRMRYDTDKIETERALLKKDGEIKDLNLERNAAQINNQKLIIGLSIGGLCILIILVYFLNKTNKDKVKQNDLLREQKLLVEEKNNEILASIQYAKRIQAAILPPKSRMKKLLDDAFVLYKPKDVVAGDFYWLEQKNDTTLFAVADCTGHGVPGAMVSVVCNNGLNRSVREHGLIDPSKILDKTREIVVEEFQKSDEDVQDGMDIALCALNGTILRYAGAHNSLWIIRNEGLLEYKANKQPIGKFDNPQPYTQHEIELQKGDTIYLFSDGFPDQFGGDKGKKYKSAKFKKFLIGIQSQPIEKHLDLIENEFENWKGTEEQVDDVCVLGWRYNG